MIGERLKELRKKHKLDQKELGDKLGLSASTIGMYENNRRNPDIKMLKTIADYFGVSTSYFFDEPKKIFKGDELLENVPEQYKELFNPENLHYVKFASEMKKNNITPEQLEEIIRFVLKLRHDK